MTIKDVATSYPWAKGHENERAVYMAVTPDKYSLPYAVADSVRELARMTGYCENYIYKQIAPGSKCAFPRFVRVWIDREDEDEAD